MKMQARMFWCALAVGAISAFGLSADPPSVVFETLDETAAVTVMDGGTPVPITSVKGHELYVAEHTYGYMINVAAADGKLKITPAVLEAGSYLLVVNTNAGEVRVNVYAPLSALPNTYEQQAAMLGISVEELKTQLGLTGTLSQERINIELPPVYYVGQSLKVSLEPSQNTMTWGINGKVVLEGPNAHDFTYTFKEPGDYLLTYVESRDGAVVASDTAATRVLPMPAVVTEVARNTEVRLSGPSGYSTYTWTHNGSPIGQSQALSYRVAGPGEHVIVCKAEGPAGGGDTFEETRYVIHVK